MNTWLDWCRTGKLTGKPPAPRTIEIYKYLVEREPLESSLRVKLKELRPKRFLPAKKTSATEDEIELILESIKNMHTGRYDQLLSRTLIILLTNSGLRSSELCRLKLEDVDLERRRVFVKLGKGNKNRTVGITPEAHTALDEYLKVRLKRSQSKFFFVNRHGKALNHLRIACGHSDISTTQGYCMTSEDKVIKDMANW